MKFAAAMLMALMLSSCGALHEDKFEITNETEHELKDVRVSFADAGAQRSLLAPGETFSFRPSPSHDGGISVSYTENGKTVKHDLGYVAPPIQMNCEFKITTDDVLGACH